LLGARGHKTGTALLGKNASPVRRSLPLLPSNLLSIGHNEIWHFGANQVEQLIPKKVLKLSFSKSKTLAPPQFILFFNNGMRAFMTGIKLSGLYPEL